jgi:hypothetical protein
MHPERLLGQLDARVKNLEEKADEIKDTTDRILEKLEALNNRRAKSRGFFAGVTAVISCIASGATLLYQYVRG